MKQRERREAEETLCRERKKRIGRMGEKKSKELNQINGNIPESIFEIFQKKGNDFKQAKSI